LYAFPVAGKRITLVQSCASYWGVSDPCVVALCDAGVVLLSKEYVRKEWPMNELRILLKRWRDGDVALVPVLYKLQVEDLVAIREQYDSHDWCVVDSKPAPEVLDKYAEDLQQLMDCTMIRPDQVGPQCPTPLPEV
jgi:hypothetical protein